MSRPSRAELAAWMADALDPDRAEDIARAVAVSPALQAELAEIRARLAEDRALPEPGWLLPPPGLRLPGAPTFSGRPLDLLGGPLRPGSRFEIELDLPAEPWEARLVVLTRRDEDWEVVFPVEEEDDVPAARLLDRAGRLRVSLTAGEAPGRQRWALAFVPLEVTIAWERAAPERWRGVRETLEARGGAVVIEREVVIRS